MIENIRFSVIIPVYNTRKYVERAIESVISQSYRNMEIIIIDDGSTDGSTEIIDSYGRLDKRVKVIHQANAGVSIARNQGLNICTGDYIGFLDSDDWLEDDTYQNAYEAIQKYHADIYVFGVDIWNKKSSFDDKVHIFDREQSIFEQINGSRFCYSMCDKIFSKKIIYNLQFNTNLTMGEDLLFSWQAVCRAGTVVYRNTVQYHYFFRENSTCNGKFSLSQLTDIQVWKYIYCSIRSNKQYNTCALEKYIGAIVSRCSNLLKDDNDYSKEYYSIRSDYINDILFKGIFSRMTLKLKIKLMIFKFCSYRNGRLILRIGDYI